MRFSERIYILLTMLVMSLLAVPGVVGQTFSVESFRQLPNDVSAFIAPVKDLNDEDCALIKVEAPEEFAFSTPLGIVKREDKTGEIWLYLPRGSKKITLKHPEWGVLRDYKFPEKLDSHMTYEMRLQTPLMELPVVEVERIVETVRDTLVLTRVDTMMLTRPKERIPFTFSAIATAGFGGDPNTGYGGVMLVAMWRHGIWGHIQTDFGRVGKTAGECDKDGIVEGNRLFYTGNTRHGSMLMTGGMIHRLSRRVNLFEGAGYGYLDTAWELAPSEGGGYVKNRDYSHSGVMFEAGVMFNFGKVAVAASVSTIKGSEWFGSVGVGYKF